MIDTFCQFDNEYLKVKGDTKLPVKLANLS